MWTLFMAFCFLTGPNTNTEVLLVHTVLVVLFFIFFPLLVRTRQRKSSIENAAPLTISFCMRWIWIHEYSCVCVCVFALGTFILHITSTKNILVLLLRKLNEWCVCELVFFCFSFSLCVHLLNSMTSNCFLYFLYCIYRTEVCAARLTWLTERV